MNATTAPILALALSAGNLGRGWGSLTFNLDAGNRDLQSPQVNQRKARKNRRRAHAAGKRHAFA